MPPDDHRPWPAPDTPWLVAQAWDDLLFAHWAVRESDLRPFVPAALPLDMFDGSSWPRGDTVHHSRTSAPRTAGRAGALDLS